MPILDQFVIQNSNGEFEWTEAGKAVTQIMKQRDKAWTRNRDFVLGWMRGMNVTPNGNTTLEFADELQEFVKSAQKLSIYSDELSTGKLIKWNYYAQSTRPINSIAYGAGLTVTNIVDDALIEDRILKLDALYPGFTEYGDRTTIYTYLDIFTQSQFNTIFGTSIDPIGQVAREHVLAWFKGVNLQPSDNVIEAYKPYIQAYLLDPRKQIDANIDIGIFLVK